MAVVYGCCLRWLPVVVQCNRQNQTHVHASRNIVVNCILQIPTDLCNMICALLEQFSF